MKHLVPITALCLLAAGCAPSARIERPPLGAISIPMSASPYEALKVGIDTLLADSLFPPSGAGIKVVSLDRNETLYELNPHALFNPASNQKLFTSFAALNYLGEDFLLSTVVRVDTARRLISVQGRGDPLLSSSDLDSIARTLLPLLPPLPAGRGWTLACDVSYFDDVWWGSGWAWDHEPDYYAPFITPLILDRNTVQVTVSPADSVMSPAAVVISPPTAYVSLENSAVTVSDSVTVPLRISRRWRERSNTLTVTGQIRQGTRREQDELSVWQPERYAATVLAERLRALGTRVDSIAIDTSGTGASPAVVYSHRLDSAITVFDKISDNLTGEVLLKIMAAERLGVPGTTEGGITLMNRLLAWQGTDTTKIVIADGSGLSRYNLTSPATVVRLLEHMYRDTVHFPAFYHALPIAGVDGTIRNRMRGTLAEGNLRAKTGTLGAVSALSGYTRTRDGEMLAFSILMQNFPGGSYRYRLTQDRIGILLSGLRREDF